MAFIIEGSPIALYILLARNTSEFLSFWLLYKALSIGFFIRPLLSPSLNLVIFLVSTPNVRFVNIPALVSKAKVFSVSPSALFLASTLTASNKLPKSVILFLLIKFNIDLFDFPAVFFNLSIKLFNAACWFSIGFDLTSGARYLRAASLEFTALSLIRIIAIGTWPWGSLPSAHSLSNVALLSLYNFTAASYCSWDFCLSTPAQAAFLFLPSTLNIIPPATSIALPIASFIVPAASISDIPVTIGIPSK